MNYKLNTKLKASTFKFDGVVHIENDDKLPYFILDYINRGENTINKMKNKLGTLSESRVRFLLDDYKKRYKIISIENDNISITNIGNIYFNTEKSYSPKYADFSILRFNNVATKKCIDIIIEKEKEENNIEFNNGPHYIICGNRQKIDTLFNKECIIQGNISKVIEKVIDTVIEGNIVEVKKNNKKEVTIDYSSEITINNFVEQVKQEIKDILLEEGLWSEEDDKFIPNIEMIENGDFDLGDENFTYLLEGDYSLDIEKDNGEYFEIECDTIEITNFQIAPDENTSIFWFLNELRNRVRNYITTNDIEQVINQINYELSEKYELYETFEYDINKLLDVLVKRKEYKLFRYINTCIDLPIDGI